MGDKRKGILGGSGWLVPRKNSSQVGGLEIDANQDGLQYAYDRDDLPEALYPEPYQKRATQKLSKPPRHQEVTEKLRGTTLRLIVALVLSIVFAIIAAALAANMALQLHQVKGELDICNNSPRNQTTSANISTMVPTSDCNNMTLTYDSVVSDAHYDLYCNTGQPNNELLSVWVYTFEDCIRACSSYAATATHNGSTCYGVSYMHTTQSSPTAGPLMGNCFLKAVQRNSTTEYADVRFDSAFLIA